MCDCMRERDPHDCSCHPPTESMARENFPPFGNPWRRGRCHHARAGFGPGYRVRQGCTCHTPKEVTAEEESQILEKQKKYLQDQIGRIDKRVEDLKTAKDA